MGENAAVRDRTLTAILLAASDLFLEKGDTTSMAEIAEAAGVGRATLYRYFPTREAMVATLLGTALDEVSSEIAALKLDELELFNAIAELARVMLGLVARYSLLFREDPIPRHKKIIKQVLGPPIENFFATRISRQEIVLGWDSKALASYFGGMVKLGFMQVTEMSRDKNVVAREIAELLCLGITPR